MHHAGEGPHLFVFVEQRCRRGVAPEAGAILPNLPPDAFRVTGVQRRIQLVLWLAAANVFWVRGGVLYTPNLATGCLAGVARQIVVDLANQLKIEVTEGSFQSDHILTADEVFLTSSTRELTRVSCINYHQFTPVFNSIFERLLKGYKQLTIAAVK